MKKLKLEMDALRVESFATAQPRPARGTVRGAQTTNIYSPCDPEPVDDSINYCGPAPTAAYTCAWTCGYTCGCGYTRTQGGYTCTCPDVPIEP